MIRERFKALVAVAEKEAFDDSEYQQWCDLVPDEGTIEERFSALGQVLGGVLPFVYINKRLTLELVRAAERVVDSLGEVDDLREVVNRLRVYRERAKAVYQRQHPGEDVPEEGLP